MGWDDRDIGQLLRNQEQQTALLERIANALHTQQDRAEAAERKLAAVREWLDAPFRDEGERMFVELRDILAGQPAAPRGCVCGAEMAGGPCLCQTEAPVDPMDYVGVSPMHTTKPVVFHGRPGSGTLVPDACEPKLLGCVHCPGVYFPKSMKDEHRRMCLGQLPDRATIGRDRYDVFDPAGTIVHSTTDIEIAAQEARRLGPDHTWRLNSTPEQRARWGKAASSGDTPLSSSEKVLEKP